ncbi:HNH endonuclease [Gordonia phage OhMyWard]|uniref:HNH endonuclease n=1 Tax=Gordonia phage OhMyWard TaxID=2652414 RepID=A0A5P8D7G6_9CAUD|nr:HNH endonuclease [Gordonia phage OhMyWard]QFP94964.1 HNH endonuclease [Gordonia phage OhMyWard]
MEIWQPIKDFPEYLVSSDGFIKHTYRKGLKSLRLNGQGDVIVDLSRDGRKHTRKLSLLVAQAYLEPPPNPAFNSVIQHDGDKQNCQAMNLSWRPRWFVVEYNRMFAHPPINISVVHEPSGEVFGTLREACVKFGLVEETAYVNLRNHDPIFPLKGTLKIL